MMKVAAAAAEVSNSKSGVDGVSGEDGSCRGDDGGGYGDRTDRRTDGRIDGRTDRRTDRHTLL